MKYKKGVNNKMVDMLSRPPINASIFLYTNSLTIDSYVEKYGRDVEFKYVYERLTHGSQVENYHFQGNLLHHVNKLCVPEDERIHVIKESHLLFQRILG